MLLRPFIFTDENKIHRAIVIAKDKHSANQLFSLINKNYTMDNFLGAKDQETYKSLIPSEPRTSCIIIIS